MGLWLLWAIPAALLTTLTGWAAFGKGKNARAVRRHAKRARHKVWTGTKTRYRATRNHYRAKRAATPRGQLRNRRKAQPLRWSGGHVRTDDDPTRTRRVARVAGTHAKRAGTGVLRGTKRAGTAALNRYRLRKANAAPKPKRRELLSRSHITTGPKHKVSRGITCGVPTGRRHDGPPCQNIPMVLPDGSYAGSCYISSHKAYSARTGEAQSRANAQAAAKAAPKPPPPPPVDAQAIRNRIMGGPAPKPPAAAKTPPRTRSHQPTAKTPMTPPPGVTRTTNVASSGFTPVQVGQQMGSAKPQVSDSERAEYDAHIARVGRRVVPPKTPTRSGNYAAPGARVGMQADSIVGNVNVTMAGRDVNTGSTVNHAAGDVFMTGGKTPKGPKSGKSKTPNAADVDQSTTTTHVAGRRITTDGTLNIPGKGDGS
jgi:hypothetical protein